MTEHSWTYCRQGYICITTLPTGEQAKREIPNHIIEDQKGRCGQYQKIVEAANVEAIAKAIAKAKGESQC